MVLKYLSAVLGSIASLYHRRLPGSEARPSAAPPSAPSKNPVCQQDPDIGLLALPLDLLADIASRVPLCWRGSLRLASHALLTASDRTPTTTLNLHPEHLERLALTGHKRTRRPLSTTFPGISSLVVLRPFQSGHRRGGLAWPMLGAQLLPAWSATLTHLDLGGLRLTPPELQSTLQSLPSLTSLVAPALQLPITALSPETVYPICAPGTPAPPGPARATGPRRAVASIAAVAHLRRLDLCTWQPHHEAVCLLGTAVGGHLPGLDDLSLRLVQGVPGATKLALAVLRGVAGCASLRRLQYEGPLVDTPALHGLSQLTSLTLRSSAEHRGGRVLQAALALTSLLHLSVTADFELGRPLLRNGGPPSGGGLHRHRLTDLHLDSWPRSSSRTPQLSGGQPAMLRLCDLQALAACPHLHTLTAPAMKAYPATHMTPTAAARFPLVHLRCLTVAGGVKGPSMDRGVLWAGALSLVFPGLTALTTALPVKAPECLGPALLQGLVHLDVKDRQEVSSSRRQPHYAPLALNEATMPSLRSLMLRNLRAFEGGMLVAVARSQPQLEALYLTHAPALDDGVAAQLAENLPRLRDVRLKECDALTSVGLRALAAGAPSLRRLVARHCRRICQEDLVALLAQWPDLDVVSWGAQGVAHLQ